MIGPHLVPFLVVESDDEAELTVDEDAVVIKAEPDKVVEGGGFVFVVRD